MCPSSEKRLAHSRCSVKGALAVLHSQFWGSHLAEVLNPSALSSGGDHHLHRFQPVRVPCRSQESKEASPTGRGQTSARLPGCLCPSHVSRQAVWVGRGASGAGPRSLCIILEMHEAASELPPSVPPVLRAALPRIQMRPGWVGRTGSQGESLAFWMSI